MIAQQLGQAAAVRGTPEASGSGSKTGIESPSESKGVLPPIDKWTDPDLAASAIGTHQAATPIQLWSAYNVIANGGRYVAPRLVDATIDPAGNRHPSSVTPQPSRQAVISPSTIGPGRGPRCVPWWRRARAKQWDLPGLPGGGEDRNQPNGQPAAGRQDGRLHVGRRQLPLRDDVHRLLSRRQPPGVDHGDARRTHRRARAEASPPGPIFSDLSRLAIRELGIAPDRDVAPTTRPRPATDRRSGEARARRAGVGSHAWRPPATGVGRGDRVRPGRSGATSASRSGATNSVTASAPSATTTTVAPKVRGIRSTPIRVSQSGIEAGPGHHREKGRSCRQEGTSVRFLGRAPRRPRRSATGRSASRS